MISKNAVTVNASAADTWKLIGDDFVAVDRWMAAIPTAKPIAGPAVPGAPARGRNSYLIKKFSPMYQEEIITGYDAQAMRLDVEVTLRNTPRFMPLKGYHATVIVEPIDDSRCTVTWIGRARTHWFATPMAGMLTRQLDPGFVRSLEEIQHFMETGEPHPRKIETVRSEAALAA